jgi:hypothetical protein
VFLARLLRVRAAAALIAIDPEHTDAPFARAFLLRSARARREDVRGLAAESLERLK